MKFLTTIVLLIGMAALLPAQTLKVTSPKSGDVWPLGSTQFIKWEASGITTGPIVIEILKTDFSEDGTITTIWNPQPNGEQYSWKVGDLSGGYPTLTPGTYRIGVINSDLGLWKDSDVFTISGLQIKPKHMRNFIEYRWPPLPGPDPCLCPEFDLKPLGEFFAKMKSPISIFLMKNGQQVQQLGNFAKGSMLPASLKAKLSQGDFDLLKNGKAKFTLTVLGARGKILAQYDLRSQTKLRQR
ncbi:MAG: GPI anchored serine-threonine rich family protein [Candidatus Aminicenantes bacterium]|nr:GPI anchored serine-threonine rich family protein [Candidatus Aminicenantes bacterium]